jgi:hypothetical protein
MGCRRERRNERHRDMSSAPWRDRSQAAERRHYAALLAAVEIGKAVGTGRLS